MIPILYRVDERSFTSNGLGRLADCVSCTVTEERNGIYEVELQYPITGKFYSEMVTNGGILSMIHDDTKTMQLFDIYGHTDPIDGIVTFYAHHVSYRLANVLLKPFTGASVADTLSKIPQNTLNACPFTFWTDKLTAGTYKLEHPSNVRAILGGTEGSILDVYGAGDYEFDNFEVKLYADRGFDTGVTIRYGKNLSNIENEVDTSSSFSAILPYWQGGEGQVVYGSIIYSTTMRKADVPWTKETLEEMEDGRGNVIEFAYPIITPIDMDFSDQFEEEPTVAQLNAAAAAYMQRNRTWLPYQNITVDFVQLWQTPEYESVAALQRVSLCDLVSVYFPEMGIIADQQKVIRVVYNVLLERYDEMEIGQAKTTFSQTLTGEFQDLVDAQSTFLKSVIQNQTDLITGGLGGYVVMELNASGQPQEILIMDTPNKNTAVNVIRMNRNGIGFSTNGYAGPFTSAWTIDGKFNADFISTGHLVANFIQGGTLTLGGYDNASGVLLVNDENGTAMTTIDKDGINTNSLTAQSYIYMDTTNTSSKLKMPMGNKVNSYFEISTSKVFYLQSYWTSTYTYIQILEEGLKYWNSYSGSYTVLGDNGVEISDAEYGGMRLAFQVHNTANTKRFIATDEGYSTTGSKSREIDSDQFGTNRFFCYETPTPVFGDIGEGVIDQDGFCIVDLDPILSSSILPKGYQVFLQKYGSGDCWVSERKPDYFVVEGTPGLSFGWELKAKQVGYDQVRYNDPTQFGSEENPTYESSIFDYMEEIIERSYVA